METDQQTHRAEPERSRPNMPEGYLPGAGEEGMLEWSDVDRRLAAARVYWLGTASPGGDPHATPIWGAWVQGAFYFEGYYEKTRWGRNLTANPRIVVHAESGSYAIMFKGAFEIVNVPPDAFKELADSYAAKYNGYKPESGQGMCSVRPHTAWAWDNENFTTTATRWRFPQS